MKVTVHCGIWSDEIYFWHKGRKLTFAKLPLAREEALRLGYEGIKVSPNKVNKPVAKPLRG